LLPRIAVVVPADDQSAADPRAWFDPPAAEVWFEVGFGKGEHLVHRAALRPDVGLIGCEPFEGGVATLLAAIEDDGLPNIRVHAEDARPLLRRLAPGSLARVFVLFPDPWPKARHHERRFVTRATLDAIAGALADGGLFRFATDDAAYLTETLAAVRAHPAFEWTARASSDWRRPADQGPMSRYEARARDQGRVAVYLDFKRRARAAQPMSSSGT
jgi:tRNA (guanine-N7-)-methyltransferase